MTETQRRILIAVAAVVGMTAAVTAGIVIGTDDDGDADASTTTADLDRTVTTLDPDLPDPVVIVDGFVLGHWDGDRWRSATAAGPDDELPPSPAETGTPYRFVRAGEAATVGPLGPTVEGCHLGNNHRVADSRADGAVGLPDGYPMTPREAAVIGAASEHRASVADWLVTEGVADAAVSIDRVLRVDLEGDGTDEVLIEASRISNPGLIGEAEGDHSVVLLRRLRAGDAVQSLVIGGDVVTPEEASADSFAGLLETTEILAVVDLNQDGDLEVVIRRNYYEGSSVEVLEIGETAVDVLGTGCGA